MKGAPSRWATGTASPPPRWPPLDAAVPLALTPARAELPSPLGVQYNDAPRKGHRWGLRRCLRLARIGNDARGRSIQHQDPHAGAEHRIGTLHNRHQVAVLRLHHVLQTLGSGKCAFGSGTGNRAHNQATDGANGGRLIAAANGRAGDAASSCACNGTTALAAVDTYRANTDDRAADSPIDLSHRTDGVTVGSHVGRSGRQHRGNRCAQQQALHGASCLFGNIGLVMSTVSSACRNWAMLFCAERLIDSRARMTPAKA